MHSTSSFKLLCMFHEPIINKFSRAGSKFGFASLVGSGPPLRLGDETITVTSASSVSPSHLTSALTSGFKYKFIVLLLALSDSKNSLLAWRWVCKGTGTVHAFVSSRVDGCNAMLAVSTKATFDHLQRVLNAAARVVSGTYKFDCGLTHLLHSECIQFPVWARSDCSSVSAGQRFSISRLRLMLPVASSSALQVAISSSCHDTTAPCSAVGRFLLQVRQPGTCCQTISVIPRWVKTLLGDH